MLALLGRLEEMLLIGKFSCHKGVIVHQGPEEKLCCLATILCPEHLIVASLTQEFWDKSVGMVGTQVWIASLQRVYLLIVIEVASHPEILLVFVRAYSSYIASLNPPNSLRIIFLRVSSERGLSLLYAQLPIPFAISKAFSLPVI